MYIQLNTIKQVINFVEISNKYDCDINVEVGRTVVDGKSIMGMFLLNYPQKVKCSILDKKDEEDLFWGELSIRGFTLSPN